MRFRCAARLSIGTTLALIIKCGAFALLMLPAWLAAGAVDFAGPDYHAIAKLRATVADRTRTLGSEHEETLAARLALADELTDTWHFAGDIDRQREAEEERRAVLAIVQRQHGTDEPATFGDWEALAKACFGQYRYGQAVKEYGGLVSAMEGTFGPEDERTLQARQARAVCLTFLGEYGEAEQELRALIALRERVPETRNVASPPPLEEELSRVAYKRNLYSGWEDMMRRRIAEGEKERGLGHRRVAHDRLNLAQRLLIRERPEEALRELEIIQAHGQEALKVERALDREFDATLERTRWALAELEEEKSEGGQERPESGEEKPAAASAEGESAEGNGEVGSTE